MGIQISKFGGSSVKDATSILQVKSIVSNTPKGLVVVLSAMGGMTDLLLSAAKNATNGDSVEEAISEFNKRHQKAIEELISDKKTASFLNKMVDDTTNEFRNICKSLNNLREITPSILDRTASRGEQLMGTLFAETLKASGLNATYIDATEVIKVQKESGIYGPDLAASTVEIKKTVLPLLKDGVVIIPGWIGSNKDGQLVTLGRGGSDLSASVLGHALEAEKVTLYKEVDGLMTADPRQVPEARVIPEMHYREATELAYYGAKVLHSRTIIPLLKHQIPLVIKNTFDPDKKGTRIAGDVKAGAYPVKALTAIKKQSIVAVEGKGMLGVPGIAARTFTALAASNTSVSVISQASSEASICFVVPEDESESAREALEEAFKFELQLGVIDSITVKNNQSVLAIVGLGMKGTSGIASRCFKALAKSNVNIEAIAQGSSELNISVVIEGSDVTNALRMLHREFRLEKLKALPEGNASDLSYCIFGFGQIGRTLIKQIDEQHAYFKNKMDFDLSCIGLADSSGFVLNENRMTQKHLNEMSLFKAKGESLKSQEETSELTELFSLNLPSGVFIDLTAEDTTNLVQKALDSGMHIALANKKPLAGPQKGYDKLFETAKSKGLMLRYEATVGAGLPILDTIAKLEVAGDEILSIQGCLSGTLGFLMTELEDGATFSEAVHKAYRLGYTEPDPREDLNGMDVGRKALILARTLGIKTELDQLGVESLFDEEHSDNDPQIFLENIRKQDKDWAARIEAAKKNGNVLRYIASIAGTEVSVSIEEVPKDSPLGRLRGTDNQVTIRTRRYDENPLIVLGPGAGAEVTAAGVLNDIIAIATQKQ
jgi:bifunctional aspartokinase / homoserine dehydrogenase 1